MNTDSDLHRRAQKAEGMVKRMERRLERQEKDWRRREALWLNESRTADQQREVWEADRAHWKALIRRANDTAERAIKDSLKTAERLQMALTINRTENALWFFIGAVLGAAVTAMFGAAL